MKRKKLMTLALLAVLGSAFITHPGSRTIGELYVSDPTPFSIKGYLNKSWQNSIEQWRNQNFGFRNSLVRLKNSIYDQVNFGFFHIAYNRNILQGDNDNLFEKGYVISHFNWDADSEKINNMVSRNVDAINKLYQRMQVLGMPFIFVMYPNKVTQLSDEWPWLWRQAKKYHPSLVNVYSIYEKELSKRGIPYINLQSLFLDRRAENYLWFSKTGTHWTVAMAQASLPDFVQISNRIGAGLSQPICEEIHYSHMSLHEETDLWLLLNRLKREQKIDAPSYPYYIFKYENVTPRAITLYGDSFNGQFFDALISSGLVDQTKSAQFQNRFLTDIEVHQTIERNGLFTMGYTLSNLNSTRIENEAKDLLKKLQKNTFISHNWYKDKNCYWSTNNGNVSFIVSKEDKDKNLAFSMSIVNKMPSVRVITVKLNGEALTTLFEPSIGNNIKIKLPKNKLVLGVNTLNFSVSGSSSPMIHNINNDWRILGFAITEPTVNID